LHNKVTKGAFVGNTLTHNASTDHDTASAAKILKDLHEQKAIEGRVAGESDQSNSRLNQVDILRQTDRLSRSAGRFRSWILQSKSDLHP